MKWRNRREGGDGDGSGRWTRSKAWRVGKYRVSFVHLTVGLSQPRAQEEDAEFKVSIKID